MTFMNFDLQLLVFEDKTSTNPLVKLPDLKRSYQNITVDNDASDRLTIYPNEVKDILVTSRVLSQSSTTEYVFDRYDATSDRIRLKWTGTGTAPAFRVDRSIGGSATTEVSISRLSNYVARISNTAGTTWSLGSVQNGDVLEFEQTTDDFTSPFTDTNQNVKFIVLSAGSTFIDVIDNGNLALDANIVLGADFAFALRVFSPGPVRVGDVFEISGAGFHPSNRGQFEILDLSYDFIEFTNPYAVEETVTLGSNSLVVYDYLIGFVLLRTTGALKVKFGNQSEWVEVGLIAGEGVFAGSLSTYRIQAFNDGPYEVSASIQHVRVK